MRSTCEANARCCEMIFDYWSMPMTPVRGEEGKKRDESGGGQRGFYNTQARCATKPI